ESHARVIGKRQALVGLEYAVNDSSHHSRCHSGVPFPFPVSVPRAPFASVHTGLSPALTSTNFFCCPKKLAIQQKPNASCWRRFPSSQSKSKSVLVRVDCLTHLFLRLRLLRRREG